MIFVVLSVEKYFGSRSVLIVDIVSVLSLVSRDYLPYRLYRNQTSKRKRIEREQDKKKLKESDLKK